MLKQQLLNDLNTVVGGYNTYFADLCSGEEVEPPTVPVYTPKQLGDALTVELGPAQNKKIDSDVFNEAMQAAKVGYALTKTTKDSQSFAIGVTRGGYRS